MIIDVSNMTLFSKNWVSHQEDGHGRPYASCEGPLIKEEREVDDHHWLQLGFCKRSSTSTAIGLNSGSSIRCRHSARFFQK
jgi:hypothetical protein